MTVWVVTWMEWGEGNCAVFTTESKAHKFWERKRCDYRVSGIATMRRQVRK